MSGDATRHPYLDPGSPLADLRLRRKRRGAAEAWLSMMSDGRLLTLRDPLALRDESRARPCTVPAARPPPLPLHSLAAPCPHRASWSLALVPSQVAVGPEVALRCAGHAPTRRALLPPLGAWDACTDVMCGVEGKSFYQHVRSSAAARPHKTARTSAPQPLPSLHRASPPPRTDEECGVVEITGR